MTYSTGRNKVAIDRAKPRTVLRGNKYRALPRAGFSAWFTFPTPDPISWQISPARGFLHREFCAVYKF